MWREKIWDSWVFIGERKFSFHFFFAAVCGGECWIAARALVAGVSGYKAINLQISIQHIRTRMVLCTHQAAEHSEKAWKIINIFHCYTISRNVHFQSLSGFAILLSEKFDCRDAGGWQLCGWACDDDELGEFSAKNRLTMWNFVLNLLKLFHFLICKLES